MPPSQKKYCDTLFLSFDIELNELDTQLGIQNKMELPVVLTVVLNEFFRGL